MGRAWKKITNFFGGGESVRGPEAGDLYGGPGPSWGAQMGSDGTWTGGTTTETVRNPAYSRSAVDAARARLMQAQLTGRGEAEAREALRAAKAVPKTITQERQGYVPASAQVRGNQTGVQAAMQALANTQRIANTGWTAQDRAAMGAADRASQRSAQAAIGALAQQGRMRGTGGSGQTFAAMAGAAQQAANAAADRGAAIAQQGAERRAQASQALAGMGMGMDAQTFGQNAQRAGAVDEFNRYATGANANALQQAYQNKRQYQEDEAARRERIMNNINQMASTGTSMFGGG